MDRAILKTHTKHAKRQKISLAESCPIWLKRQITISFLFLFYCSRAWAAPHINKHLREPNSVSAQRVLVGSPLAENERISKELKKQQIQTEKYIPLNLDPEKDKDSVFIKMADRTLNTFLNTEAFKRSSLGSKALEMQEQFKTEMNIQSKKVTHRLTSEVLAFEGKAKMSYRGFFNVDLTTSAFGETQFKIYENLFGGSIFLEQTKAETEELSQIGLKMPW